jgi:hypothetical protein
MRNRAILLLPTSVIMIACTCGLPSVVIPTMVIPMATVPPTETPAATDYIPATETPLATATAVPAVTIVRLHPRDGELISQIIAKAPKATALGQKMFVEFDASW